MFDYNHLAKNHILRDKYEIRHLLGQGGMGAVYLARDLDFDDYWVAVKENFMQTGPIVDRAASQRQFRQEANILRQLKHTNLPQVTAQFVVGDRQYMVMDFIEGQNLQEKIKSQSRPLPEIEALEIIIQICEALIYLHRQKPPVIHRDIKPQNIKVTPAGKAVLVDFGLVKVGGASHLTQQGASGFVTPGFSPPEQYSGRTTPPSDIYALGATLYTILAGRRPPSSTSILSGMALYMPPRVLNPTISEWVSRAISHAMKLSVPERPKSIAIWQAQLQAILQSLSGQTTPTISSSDQTQLATQQTQVAHPFLREAQTQPQIIEPLANTRIWKKDGKEMIRIPTGDFLYGGQFSYGYKETRNLPQYWIDKTPVTNTEYARFVKETGYQAPNYWHQSILLQETANHPVTYVSWLDAQAYTKWANKRLPSEMEWEKAAGGTEGRDYPWGNQPPTLKLANFAEKVGTTTPVGFFSPQGDSPYGLFDCAGNVREWCQDWYDDEQKTKVLRGGSWDSVERFLLINYRHFNYPHYRYDDIGFRCVVSSE